MGQCARHRRCQVQARHGHVGHAFDRRQGFHADQLSTFLLKKLLADAEAVLGPIGEAVVTIPANFAHEARDATMAAAKAAGLNVNYIINEPTAAALYYAFQSGDELSGMYAVYDLGGGTFDVSIIRVDGQDVEVMAKNGVSKLGGDDIDEAIQNLVRQQCLASKQIELEPDDFTKNDAEGGEKRRCQNGTGYQCALRVRWSTFRAMTSRKRSRP